MYQIQMVVNIDLLIAMTSIWLYTKLKVSIILCACIHHFSIVYIILVPNNFCRDYNIDQTVRPSDSKSGYVFCTRYNYGTQQFCPPGTEVTFGIGRCVNKTSKWKGKIIFWFVELFCLVLANTTVFPAGSRCASSPCENGALCLDLSSADTYHCLNPYPCTGVHCQKQERRCPRFACGNRTSEIVPECVPYTSDKALLYICTCYADKYRGSLFYAFNDCHSKKVFYKYSDRKEPVLGAFPFTNKAFYICLSHRFNVRVESCNLHHVWNDTLKECVPEYTSL